MFVFGITNGGRSNGRATPKSLESSIDDFSGFVVDLNLELHDITASRCPHQTRPHARVVLVERSNIPGIVVMIHNPLVVPPRGNPNAQRRRSQNPLCAHSQHLDFPLHPTPERPNPRKLENINNNSLSVGPRFCSKISIWSSYFYWSQLGPHFCKLVSIRSFSLVEN